MKQFAIKSEGPDPSLLELINETEGGYFVRIVHRHEDWDDVKEDSSPESCSTPASERAISPSCRA